MKKLFLLCLVLVACSAFKRVTYEPHPFNYKDEVKCLAQNIYFEARDQTTKGQIAVALVTINRVESKQFPNSICKVVYQASRYRNGKIKRDKCQFSWYCDGKADDPRDSDTWEECMNLALILVVAPGFDITEGSLWYHANYVNPYWAEHLTKVITINAHIFYK